MSNLMVVGGTYDEAGGRASGYVAKLCEALRELMGSSMDFVNGGTYEHLEGTMRLVWMYSHLLWMADVPNSYPKLLPGIMELNRDLVLIQSKNNRSLNYDDAKLFERMSHSGAKYLLEFRTIDNMIVARLLSQDGRVVMGHQSDIKEVARHLKEILE